MPTDKNAHGALADVLSIAARYKAVIILTTIVVPIVALVVSTQQQRVYRATSEVLLDRQDLGAALTGIPNNSSDSDPERYSRTQAAIASVPAVAQRAVRISGVTGLTGEELLRNSTVSPRLDSDLLRFTVDNASAANASRLATAYASAFTSYKLATETASLTGARKELEGRLTDLRAQGAIGTQMYADVFKKVQDVRTLELLQARASVVRPATDGNQVQPRPVRSAALGVALGLLLGFGFAVLWNALDKRIRNEEEVEEGLGIPLLAKLPRYTIKARGRDSLVMLGDPAHAAAESVRLLRTNLELSAIGNDAKTIMVTSAAPREGKSTTISNLAVALARAGHQVALVDLDLREPTIARAFDLEGRPGITDVTMEHVALEDALVSIRLTPASVPRASYTGASEGALHVLPAGTIPPDPGEFVAAQRVALVIQALRQQHDFVLLDAPPLLAVGDAVSISTITDALFVVVRLDVIDRPMLRDMARGLNSCPCAKLGFVLTNVEARELYGASHYGHDVKGRGSDEQRAPLRGVAATPR
jgi:capsular exopolysaccharide synthesis family protein